MENLAPPVVAVIVTRDPGPWFDDTLRAFAAQDYPELSVLVLDASSEQDPTARVAAILPGAFVRRLEENGGFGANADEALAMVQGASHLLLCHDDVAPDPDAVHILVEESVRSNAGIVGPKFVSWDDPTRLLHVGMAVDKGGAVVDRVELGEIDHGQHDAVQDVFLAPGGFTLVRADLFRELGGFSPRIVAMGEDLDLCWRAQIAGARVVVAPAARVRHLERLASGQSDVSSLPAAPAVPAAPAAPSLQALQRRHELRAALVGYGRLHLARVLPQLMVLAAGELAVAMITGNRERAAALRHAWRWNWSLRSEVRSVRAEVRTLRRLPDGEVRRLQLHGSARLTAYLRRAFTHGLHVAHAGAEAEALVLDESADDPDPQRARRQIGRPGRVVVWTVVVLVIVTGSRELLGLGLPYVSDLMPLPGWGELLHRFAASWQPTGVGTTNPSSPATAWLGVAGMLLGGSTGLLQKILVLGSLPVGALGMTRLLRPFGSSGSHGPRLAAAVSYLALPVAYDALAMGRADALFFYAAAPWIVAHLARAAGVAPFASTADHLRPWRHSTFGRALALGAMEAVLFSLAPSASIGTLLLVGAMSLGFLVVTGGNFGAVGRTLVVGLGGLAVATVMLAPWSVFLLAGPARWQALTGMVTAPASGPKWAAVLHLAVGPIGDSPLAFGLVAAAALSLAISARRRLTWACQGWVMALASWVVTWTEGRGWLGALGVEPQMLLVPAAVGLAMAIGIGVAGFERDLPAYRFGWRQVAAAGAAAAALVGILPVLGAAGSGRWDLPLSGYGQATAWMAARTPPGGFRVLWLGDPRWLPGKAWHLDSGVGYMFSSGGPPDATGAWVTSSPGPAAQVASDVELAEGHGTVQLGGLIAPYAVRFVVVVSALAPVIPGYQSPSSSTPPARLVDALDDQTDLTQVESQGGLRVYVDNSALPEWASHAQQAASGARGGSAGVAMPAASSPGWSGLKLGPGSALEAESAGSLTASIPTGTSVLLRAPADIWQLAGPGSTTANASTGFGYAAAFNLSKGGVATVRARWSPSHFAEIAAEVVLWIVVAGALAGRRRWLDSWWNRLHRGRAAQVAGSER